MKKFFVFGGLLAMLSSAPVLANPQAAGEVAVQGLKVFVTNPGITEAVFVRQMAGHADATLAKAIFARIGNNGAADQLFNLRLSESDWASLAKLARDRKLTPSQVINRTVAALGTSSAVEFETLSVAFNAATEPAVQAATVSASDIAEVEAGFVPQTEAGMALAEMAESGDPAQEAVYRQFLKHVAILGKNAARTCGMSCSVADIARLKQNGQQALARAAAYIQPLKWGFVQQAITMTGEFANAPFPVGRYVGGLGQAGLDARQNALDEQLAGCLVAN